MQGSIDHEGALNGRFNYGWTDSDITKIQANVSLHATMMLNRLALSTLNFKQIQSSAMVPSMIQLEHDRAGRDYSLNFKAYNPGVVDGTGVFMGSYLQSVTKRLALGAECIWQRPNADVEEANMSYMAKYVGGADRDWIATAQLIGSQGVVQGTYWQRLSDKVEAGAELTFAPAPMPKDRKAQATVAAKYDFRLATLRAQLDSAGKVSAFLEQRFTPAFSFLVTGEIDHWKVRYIHAEWFASRPCIFTDIPVISQNSSKFGIGIQLESSTLDEAEAQAQAMAAQLKPPV
jgi:mitochondrial import receptor subunit TOM40